MRTRPRRYLDIARGWLRAPCLRCCRSALLVWRPMSRRERRLATRLNIGKYTVKYEFSGRLTVFSLVPILSQRDIFRSFLNKESLFQTIVFFFSFLLLKSISAKVSFLSFR